MTSESSMSRFLVSGSLYGVFDRKTGELLVIVEARDTNQAKQRADWVAPFFGWRRFEEDQVREVSECTDRIPTFFEDYFVALDRDGATLH